MKSRCLGGAAVLFCLFGEIVKSSGHMAVIEILAPNLLLRKTEVQYSAAILLSLP